MPTTQCLRVALFVPTNAPVVGDGVQVASLAPIKTRWVGLGGGTNLPIPSAEGDVIQANAGLTWIAAPLDGGMAIE